MRFTVLVLLVGGCYTRPDFLPDRPDEVPLGTAPTCANRRDAIVACTLDGDTFDVGACGDEAGERIRMLGIDAPEISHDGNPADCYGDAAAAELQRVLQGQDVVLTFDTTCLDVYDRTLAYVWIEDVAGTDTGEQASYILVNEYMLENGWARLFDEDWVEPLLLQQRMESAQSDARARGVGLWAECGEDG